MTTDPVTMIRCRDAAMTPEPLLTANERFDILLAAAVLKDRGPELTLDIGDPQTVGDALRIFRALPDFDGTLELDRSILELKYGDEIEWLSLRAAPFRRLSE